MRRSLLPAAGPSKDTDRGPRAGYRALVYIAALVVVALVAAACGGGGTSSSAAGTTTTPTTGNRAAQTQAFLSCMQSHGVKITSTRGLGGGGLGGGGGGAAGDTGSAPPSSVPGVTRPPATLPPGVTQAQYDAALQACRSLLPARGNFQNNPAFQAYRNCINLQLTQHGAPTLPANGGGFGGGQQSGNTTTTNPALQAAQAHCANLLPAGGFGGPRSSTTSTT